MRLAIALGRTVGELRESMDAEEWDDWIAFHALYDLPDGFFVVAQLGTLIAGLVNEKNNLKAGDLVPYFRPEKPAIQGHNPSLAAAFAFLRANPDVCQPKPKPV